MKKFKILFGVIMSCALAFACLAFTACGDDTFNIDTSRTATDEQLLAITENIGDDFRADTTSLAKMFGGKTYAVSFDSHADYDSAYLSKQGSYYHKENQLIKLSASAEGVFNVVKENYKMTAAIDLDLSSTGGTKKKVDMDASLIVADKKIYAAKKRWAEVETENDKNTQTSNEKIVQTLEKKYFNFGSGLFPTAADRSVDDYLARVKSEFTINGHQFDPRLYISGGVMKVALNAKSYFGLAFDINDRTLTALDIVLKDIPVPEVIGVLFGANADGDRKDVGMELKIRACADQVISVPSDAADYEPDEEKDIFYLLVDVFDI